MLTIKPVSITTQIKQIISFKYNILTAVLWIKTWCK